MVVAPQNRSTIFRAVDHRARRPHVDLMVLTSSTIDAMASTFPTFPPAAGQWLIGGRGLRVLVVGLSAFKIVPTVGDHQLTVVVDDVRQGQKVHRRRPEATVVVADPHRLPLLPTSFDAVLVSQSLHQLTLGEAVQEFARVLKPGGRIAVAYTVRDDSVPWVRRLIALVRGIDPTAMPGSYGKESVSELAASPFVSAVAEEEFRLWVPISRVGLLDMVASRFPQLEQGRLAALLEEVGELYESSSRAPQPLLLPYRVSCVRVSISHEEFTSALHPPTQGIPIRL